MGAKVLFIVRFFSRLTYGKVLLNIVITKYAVMRDSLRRVCIAIFILISSVEAKAQVVFPTEEEARTNFPHRRVLPVLYYANPDKIYAGIRFMIASDSGRDGHPSGYQHSVQLRYSLSQNAFSTLYDGNFYELIGRWNLSLSAYYDWMVWTNFFGLGNETANNEDIRYYRLSTSEYAGNVSLNRIFKDRHYVDISAFVQGIEVLDRSGYLVENSYVNDQKYYFEHHIYTSLRLGYAYQNVDNDVLPTSGVMFYAGATYTLNTYQTDKSFLKGNALAQVYIPVSNKFSFSLRAGGAGITGTPEFYQYVSVGGPMTMRGYKRDRFWGNTMFYNSNEFRWITDLRVRKWNNKIGLFLLFDDGRVWLDGEDSHKLHYGWGGGILASPLNKFTAMASYAVSEDGGILQFKLTKLLYRFPASRSAY
jgi:outer membrane protein assembly factor BamA